MTKKERYERVIDYFLTNMPVAETELEYRNPYELLVAVILSAQCTDKRVNIVTRQLFKQFPDAESLANVVMNSTPTNVRLLSNQLKKIQDKGGDISKILDDFKSSDAEPLRKIYEQVKYVDTGTNKQGKRVGKLPNGTIEVIQYGK